MPRRPYCSAKRVRALNALPVSAGPVLYWMSRDQRARDNWALLHAQQEALSRSVPLVVVFALADSFLGATERHYAFMFTGLRETAVALETKRIPFTVVTGVPGVAVAALAAKLEAGLVVTDFDPLRIKRLWKEQLVETCRVRVEEVDAHNIVPCWVASPKQEFAAYTIRPKIHRVLAEFLEPFPALVRHPHAPASMPPPPDWADLQRRLALDSSVGAVDWIRPGTGAGMRRAKTFLAAGLPDYEEYGNDPNQSAQSDLSAYLHFGQIAPQRVALMAQALAATEGQKAAFIEQLVIRRELSDNFCYYNPQYDATSGFHSWASKTIDEHRGDPREYVYERDAFEQAATHDPLWNAAQREMVVRGKMHGFMRMYWAKKILEWTATPEDAMNVAIYLNDRYSLDGRDPNGYVGIGWAIGGVHDRAWAERAVFGKIRYMNYNGCRSKFRVKEYEARWGGGAS